LGSKILAPFDPKMSAALNAYVRNLRDLRETFAGVDEYILEFIHYWKSLRLDAVIGTVLPFPALQHDGPGKFSHGAFGTMLYNMLDFPAGVVSVTKVTKGDEDEMENYPNPESAGRFFQNPVNKMMRKAMENSEGLPVGVQVITLPYQEELCLKVMKDIESGLRKD